jgi:hypothetical protein
MMISCRSQRRLTPRIAAPAGGCARVWILRPRLSRLVQAIGRRGLVALAVAAAVVLSVAPARGQPPTVTLSTPLHADVTGAPAPVSTLRRAIQIAAHGAFPQLEDAEITLTATRPDLVPLSPGRSVTVRASLAVTTPGAGAIVWVVPITLRNVPMVWRDARRLFLSDSPETVGAEGILYSGSLSTSDAARILYHHQNGRRDRDMWLLLLLSNPTPSPVRVWVSGARGGPSTDELLAGHTAAAGFLTQYWTRAGVLVDLPPNGLLPLLATRVPPGQVASGLAQFTVLQGKRADVQLEAQFPREGEPPIPSRVLPVDTQHQRGTFGAPLVMRTLSYRVAGPVAELWVGAEGGLLRDETSGAPLSGNYGVIYTFDVHIVNPGPDPATVVLAMHANSGAAGATVRIDGRLVGVRAVQPNAPRELVTFRVPAGATNLRVSTMSEAGSNYPVLFTIGPP